MGELRTSLQMIKQNFLQKFINEYYYNNIIIIILLCLEDLKSFTYHNNNMLTVFQVLLFLGILIYQNPEPQLLAIKSLKNTCVVHILTYFVYN